VVAVLTSKSLEYVLQGT